MTLTELQNEVYAITNRPDLADRTLSAIRAATLYIHQSDYYYKDLFETGIAFLTEDYLQQFEFRSVIPQFRSLKYTRKTDINLYDQGDFFEIITPDAVVDDYKINRTNVCYIAGSVVQYRSSSNFQYALFGCYLNPVITTIGYSSWVATDHPFAIVYRAAANIFKSTGKQEEWAAATQDANVQLDEVKISNIQTQGY